MRGGVGGQSRSPRGRQGWTWQWLVSIGGGGGGEWARGGARPDEMTIAKVRGPSSGKGYFGAEAGEMFSGTPNLVQNLEKICRSNNVMAHQIDQRHALNMMMWGGGGGQKSVFFSDDQKWSKLAHIGRPNFLSVISSSGGGARGQPPPLPEGQYGMPEGPAFRRKAHAPPRGPLAAESPPPLPQGATTARSRSTSRPFSTPTPTDTGSTTWAGGR